MILLRNNAREEAAVIRFRAATARQIDGRYRTA
jgi:hypothetical protein